MCVVSMVGDHFHDKWKDNDWLKPYIQPGISHPIQVNPVQMTQDQFEQLLNEVREMRKLLERALEYDKRNNEPHCEIEEKIATLKKVAELVGVSLEDLFEKK